MDPSSSARCSTSSRWASILPDSLVHEAQRRGIVLRVRSTINASEAQCTVEDPTGAAGWGGADRAGLRARRTSGRGRGARGAPVAGWRPVSPALPILLRACPAARAVARAARVVGRMRLRWSAPCPAGRERRSALWALGIATPGRPRPRRCRAARARARPGPGGDPDHCAQLEPLGGPARRLREQAASPLHRPRAHDPAPPAWKGVKATSAELERIRSWRAGHRGGPGRRPPASRDRERRRLHACSRTSWGGQPDRSPGSSTSAATISSRAEPADPRPRPPRASPAGGGTDERAGGGAAYAGRRARRDRGGADRAPARPRGPLTCAAGRARRAARRGGGLPRGTPEHGRGRR